MAMRRLGCALAGVLAIGCSVTACSSSQSGGTTTTTSSSTAQSVVALGDSVPRGTNCDCRPYPPLTADKLTARRGRDVIATNDSVAGATTSTVLQQVESNGDVI